MKNNFFFFKLNLSEIDIWEETLGSGSGCNGCDLIKFIPTNNIQTVISYTPTNSYFLCRTKSSSSSSLSIFFLMINALRVNNSSRLLI